MILNVSIAAIVGAASISIGSHNLASGNTAKTNQTAATSRPKVETAATTPQLLPAPEAATIVTVQPGDYLEKIATANGTTSLRLFYANSFIADPDVILVGQQIRIPKADEVLAPRAVPVEQPAPVVASAPRQIAPSQPITSAPSPAVAGGGVWDRLAACEAGGNWSINTGNGYYGGLQFSLSSWRGVGGSGLPSEASREEQIMRGQMLQSSSGWGAWPSCSAKLGLR